MIVDGNAIAKAIHEDVKKEIVGLGMVPRLTVFTCAPNFETQKYLHLKQRRAAEVGIMVTVVTLPADSTTEAVIDSINDALPHTDGMIVQLPFPAQIDIEAVLAAVPSSHDVDALRYRGEITDVLPPVVGAIDAIAQRHGVAFAGMSVAIVGQGRLVGIPAAAYAAASGGVVSVIEKDTPDTAAILAAADILILGAGVPGLLTAAVIKPGAVVFDAGTTEEGGVLVGDADSAVSMVASLVTPVPGGIGPITIAILLQNLVRLARPTRGQD